MASGATKQRASAARRARPETPTARESAQRAAKKASTAAKKASSSPARRAVTKAVTVSAAGKHGKHGPKRLVKAAATKAAKTALRRTLRSGVKAIQLAADRAKVARRDAVEAGISRRLPIQLSIDVAVPIGIAWEQWRTWGSLPEGVHRIEDVERDGDALLGHTAGPHPIAWEAEILDEREGESFAWRSTRATDCAGLATFHEISDRLTRIELDLDVLPTNTSQAATFALHLAHRHARADLRRFKAHVEFINPDAYERSNGRNGHRKQDN